MKRLLIIILAFLSLQLSAQTQSSLPVASVPYGNVYLDTSGNVWAGANGKTFKKIGLMADVIWLNDSIGNLRTSINGKADKSTVLTINGVAQNISTSRSWTIPTVTSLSALTDVSLGTLLNNQLLKWHTDSSKWINWTPTFIEGSGTAFYMPYFSASGTIANSNMRTDGASFGFGKNPRGSSGYSIEALYGIETETFVLARGYVYGGQLISPDFQVQTGSAFGSIKSTNLTTNRNFELPNASGTLLVASSFGTSGQVLTSNGTTATFQDAAGGITLAAIGSTPNANGASFSSGTLTLQPASASFGGIVLTGAQTFGSGDKSFGGKINAGSVPATQGALNTNQDGIYSYRNGDANRYVRFNAAGTFNDFLSFGAKLVMNFGFSGTVQDISMFEGSAAGNGTFKVGSNAATDARVNIKGKSSTSADFALRVFNSSDTELFSARNDGQVKINGSVITLANSFTTSGANSITLTTTGATNVTLPTTGTLATTAGLASYTPYTGAASTVNFNTQSLQAGNATFSGELRSYRAVYTRVHNLSSVTTLTENHNTVLVNAASGAMTIILLSANSSQIWDAAENVGVTYVIKKTDSSANNVTVQGIIDGVHNPVLSTQYQTIIVKNDGLSNIWYKVN